MLEATILISSSILLVIEWLFKPRLEFTNSYRHCVLFYGRGIVRKTKIIY